MHIASLNYTDQLPHKQFCEHVIYIALLDFFFMNAVSIPVAFASQLFSPLMIFERNHKTAQNTQQGNKYK